MKELITLAPTMPGSLAPTESVVNITVDIS